MKGWIWFFITLIGVAISLAGLLLGAWWLTFVAGLLIGALIGGRVMSADDVTSLARLPGRPQLQATFVGTLQAPLAGIVGVLTAAQGNLVRVLQARGSQ